MYVYICAFYARTKRIEYLYYERNFCMVSSILFMYIYAYMYGYMRKIKDNPTRCDYHYIIYWWVDGVGWMDR
jgi:hypothetical protein